MMPDFNHLNSLTNVWFCHATALTFTLKIAPAELKVVPQTTLINILPTTLEI
jgi:hypothetical protein